MISLFQDNLSPLKSDCPTLNFWTAKTLFVDIEFILTKLLK